MSEHIQVVEIDYDHSHQTRTYVKNDDGSASGPDGDIAISPSAVFPKGGTTFVDSFEQLCGLETPPPILRETSMAVLAFRGDGLPIEHWNVYSDEVNRNERASRIGIIMARNARQEVGQRTVEQTAHQRQYSDTFLLLVKVTAVTFVIAVVAIIFLLTQQGGEAGL